MNAIANLTKIGRFQGTTDVVSNGARAVQNASSSELRGATFAFIVLLYYVSSLISLT